MKPMVDRDQLSAVASRAMARLAHLIRSAKVLPPGHPAMANAARTMGAALGEVVTLAGPLSITLREGRLGCGLGRLRMPEGMKTAAMALEQWLAARDLGGVRVMEVPDLVEVDAFVGVLQGLHTWELGQAPLDVKAVNAQLRERGVVGLAVVALGESDHPVEHHDDRAMAALQLYLRGARAVQRMHERGVKGATVRELGRVGQGLVELVEEDWRRAMVLVGTRDSPAYHLRHPVHTAILSVALGMRLGIEGPQLLDLALCAFAADSGMAAIPSEIREKTAPLTAEERAVLFTHPLESVRTLLRTPRLTPGGMRRLRVAFEHHVGVDGQGYPAALRWPGQHVYSRIVALADAFDALRADRPHRPALSPAEALAALRSEAGMRFDGDLLDHFEALIRPELGLSLPPVEEITDVIRT